MTTGEGTPFLFQPDPPRRRRERKAAEAAAAAAAAEAGVAPVKAPGAAPVDAPATAPDATVDAAPGTAPAKPAKAAKPSKASASKPAEGGTHSPMMQQFYKAKKEAGDALLMFRMGDFYELFHEDAKIASRVLGIALTSRSKGEGAIPMAGVPAKAYENYVQQLIRAGLRVAICDQVEDPKTAKGIVDRQLTRIVTAGTVFEDDLLQRGTSNWLAAVAPVGERCGLAWVDVSTGDFRVTDVATARIADEISRLDPAEILLPESLLDRTEAEGELVQALRRVTPAPLVAGPEWTFDGGNAHELLCEQLGVRSLQGYGLEDRGAHVAAAGAVLAYVRTTQRGSALPVSELRRHDPEARAQLDRATRSCLEVLATQRDGRREGSLLSVVDATLTAMGARLLREWLVQPLVDVDRITARQSAVAELAGNAAARADLRAPLSDLPDLERIATRLLAGRAGPRDLASLRTALGAAPAIKATLSACDSVPLAAAGEYIQPLPELHELLQRGLAERPAPTLGDGGLIAPGWNAELDRLRTLKEDATEAIARFQRSEIERTGIDGLKVGFNKVFGYFVEISHAQARGIELPDDYMRKQTLTSAERYITAELKELETSILTADERGKALEAELFIELRDRAAADGEGLRGLARALARVDVLAGFAEIAASRDWVRPTVDDSDELVLLDGRHPVLEAVLAPGELVPNDARLSAKEARLVLITGPNMAGKSTYLRQVALLVLLAQVGSFVPAASAHVGVVDRIFTRLGSTDDLAAGVSTFMVEMTETAAILNNATDRSLVILDEVGRGTSTWDGLSLAWALCEYLYKKIACRTLFATHYHELVDLAEEFEAVRNVNVAVKEWGDDVVFMHKIVPGGTDRSYGLHVARLAGVPREVIERAQRILSDLEQRSPDLKPGPQEAPAGATGPEPTASPLFPRPGAAVLDEITALDPDCVAPMEALVLLRRFHRLLGGNTGQNEDDGVGDGDGEVDGAGNDAAEGTAAS